MTRPPSVPSQGLLDVIGHALAQTFGVGSGASHEPLVPPVVPRPKRARAVGRRRPPRDDAIERLVVEGRWGLCEFTGKCVSIVKEWDPSLLGLVDTSPVDEEVMIWGRRWIVKTSSLGERHGYGVFACEDIILEDGAGREGPTLFPYGGPIYKRRHWNMILQQHPEWKTYALEMDTFDGTTRRFSEGRVIDGDLVRSGNIAGYINSSVGTRPKRRANYEWIFVEGPPPTPYGQTYHKDYVLVVATRTIRAGDELFTHYEWD